MSASWVNKKIIKELFKYNKVKDRGSIYILIPLKEKENLEHKVGALFEKSKDSGNIY